jgi:dihydrofolate synthase/folylpolyglutamate synthase
VVTDLERALAALRARASRGMTFGTEGTREALGRLGAPQQELRAVHVAGTNGKGSVVAFVESVARSAGLRTGTFTSPPLGHLAECIRIDGAPIADAPFAEALQCALTSGPALSLFETLTVAAFVALRDARVELALVEAGLGGRLDATNVIPAPLATAIVHVDLDHIAELGDSLAAIARHKAGIGRPGVPMILGPLPAEASLAASNEARAAGAFPVLSLREGPGRPGELSFGREGDALCLAPWAELGMGALRSPLGLRGPHQAANGAVAAALVGTLEPTFRGLLAALPRGLREARWAGRCEVIEVSGRRVVLDVAHNPSGARALAVALQDLGADPRDTTMVLGIAADKAYEAMFDPLSPVASRWVLTEPVGRRGVALERLARRFPGETRSDPVAAFERALTVTPLGGTVVVTGSFYVVGPVRAALLHEGPGDGVVLGAPG